MSKEAKSYSSKDGRLPGDPSRQQLIERIIRVNQAGEFGAVRIYKGQLSVLGMSDKGPVIQDMLTQEVEHLETFDKMVAKRRVRPTALMPLWHVAGFALGAGTALMGEKAAMACTVAVEEVIDEHYATQVEKLNRMDGEEQDLSDTCEQFRQDELAHRDTALEHDAEKAPAYEGLSALIKTGSRMAIWLSERI